MGRSRSNQEAHFEKWQRLAPPSTRLLSSLVASQLVPLLEAQGFTRVSHTLRQPDQPVAGREIELERWNDGCVDTVTFNFDKYRAPRLQVQLSRRSSEQPHAWVRAQPTLSGTLGNTCTSGASLGGFPQPCGRSRHPGAWSPV